MKTQALRDGLNCDINVLFSEGDLAEAERIRAALRYIAAHDDLVKALRLCRDELASWDRDSDPMDPSNVAIDAADAALAAAEPH